MEHYRGRTRQRSAPHFRSRNRNFTPYNITERNDNNFSSHFEHTYPPRRRDTQRVMNRSGGPYRHTTDCRKKKYTETQYNIQNDWHYPNNECYDPEPAKRVVGPNRPPYSAEQSRFTGQHRPPSRRLTGHQDKRNRTTRTGKTFQQDTATDSEFLVEEDLSSLEEVSVEPDLRGEPGRAPHIRTQIQRSRNVLSFSNHSGRFNRVNLNLNRGPEERRRDRRVRYFPQKKVGVKHHHTNYTQQHTDYTPASPKLKIAIKLIYQLIRLTHHMGKVTTKIDGNQPITFKRLTDLLINTVKPAFPNDHVRQMLQGNAKNWAFTTQLILEQHYETLIENTIGEIREQRLATSI